MIKIIVFVTTIIVLTSAIVNAQQRGLQTLSQLQESPAGSKILEHISMINETSNVSEDWIARLFAPKLIEAAGAQKLIDLVLESRSSEGQIHIYEANRAGMFRYKLKVKGVKSGEWLEMVFTFEESEPYRILGITLDNTDNGSKAEVPIFPRN